VLGINVFGDGVRDALDPRARVKISAAEEDSIGEDTMEVAVRH